MTPTDLAYAINGAVNDADFYSHLEGGLPGVERTILLGNSVVVFMESGHVLLVQVSRAPSEAYL